MARKPLDLDSADEYVYDNREDVFLNSTGTVVTPEQMLDNLYRKHWRTTGRLFLIRWKAGSAIRWTAQQAVWRGQDAAMWALLNLYDIELTNAKEIRWLFHQYSPKEFTRITARPDDRSQFFGFQSSRKSLVTNVVVLVLACAVAYWTLPHTGLFRAIYKSDALTTAALGFGFLVADLLGPKL